MTTRPGKARPVMWEVKFKLIGNERKLTTMDERLKLCPDCKNYFLNLDQVSMMRGYVVQANGLFYVLCTRFACTRKTASFKTEESAIKAWNDAISCRRA